MTAFYIFAGLVFLILVHELGHFLTAKFFRIKVEEFGLGFPPRIWGKKFKETIYSINWIPFGGFVRILGESPLDESATTDPNSFLQKPIWQRALVLSAGVIMNVIFGWLILSYISLVGVPSSVIIQAVSLESPAFEAGFEIGDVIVDFDKSDNFINYLNEHKGETVSLNIKRGGETITLNPIIRFKAPANQGLLGVSLIETGKDPVSFGLNFIDGAKNTGTILSATFSGLIGAISTLFVGSAPEVIGPVGLMGFAYQMGPTSFIFILNLLAIISLNLAIINLLPFPAIDGGRLIFLLVEKIKGSPVPARIESYTNAFGFLILLVLMVLVTIKDISLL